VTPEHWQRNMPSESHAAEGRQNSGEFNMVSVIQGCAIASSRGQHRNLMAGELFPPPRGNACRDLNGKKKQ